MVYYNKEQKTTPMPAGEPQTKEGRMKKRFYRLTYHDGTREISYHNLDIDTARVLANDIYHTKHIRSEIKMIKDDIGDFYRTA